MSLSEGNRCFPSTCSVPQLAQFGSAQQCAVTHSLTICKLQWCLSLQTSGLSFSLCIPVFAAISVYVSVVLQRQWHHDTAFTVFVIRWDLGGSQICLTSMVSKEYWTFLDRSGSNLTMVLAVHLMVKKQMGLLHHPPFEMPLQHMMSFECAKNKGLKWLRADLLIIIEHAVAKNGLIGL